MQVHYSKGQVCKKQAAYDNSSREVKLLNLTFLTLSYKEIIGKLSRHAIAKETIKYQKSSSLLLQIRFLRYELSVILRVVLLITATDYK